MSKKPQDSRPERICDLCSDPAEWSTYTLRRVEAGKRLTLRFCSTTCLQQWVEGEIEAEKGMPISEALNL